MICPQLSVSAFLVLALCTSLRGVGGSPAASEAAPGRVLSIEAIDSEPIDTEDGSLVNLGYLGVRIKAEHLVRGSCDARADDATVQFVFVDGPSDGKLRIGDVIVGVNDEPFGKDLSQRMAEALDESGATGELKLSIRRGEKAKVVKFKIPKTGSFASSYPYECKKSERLLEEALDYLVSQQQSDGSFESPFVQNCLAGLALLAAGERQYEKPLRKLAKTLIAQSRQGVVDWPNETLGNWDMAYAAIFLSEYYLHSGDRGIPEILAGLYRGLIGTQYANTPPEDLKRWTDEGETMPAQWWGHGPVARLGGYANLGAIVATNLIAFGLMHECKVPVDMENVDSIMDYIARVSPSGAMGYSSKPYDGGVVDEFGRTGALATGLLVLNRRPKHAQRSVEALTGTARGIDHVLSSHSASGLGKWWGLAALARADAEGFRKVMDHYRYDFELARFHDGRFVWNPRETWGYAHLGYWEAGNEPHHLWTTTFNALILAIPRQNLSLLK